MSLVIKYEVNLCSDSSSGEYLTLCPFNKKGFIGIYKVGSSQCFSCEHFVMNDRIRKEVTCFYTLHEKGEKKEDV